MLRNNYFFGMLVGVLVSILGMLLTYVVFYMSKVDFESFLDLLQHNPARRSSILSLSLVTFIPLFTYYKNRRLYNTLYGIFIVTGIYAVIIIYSKFFA